MFWGPSGSTTGPSERVPDPTLPLPEGGSPPTLLSPGHGPLPKSNGELQPPDWNGPGRGWGPSESKVFASCAHISVLVTGSLGWSGVVGDSLPLRFLSRFGTPAATVTYPPPAEAWTPQT